MAHRLEQGYQRAAPFVEDRYVRRQFRQEEEFLEEGPQRGWGETAYEFISNRLSDGYGGFWMGMGALAVGSLGLLVTKTVYALFVSTPSI
ncbi:MAG: hypothetical protein KDK69_01890 [Chlamydiia bacterium]|nr:hypothetical protein [Chlamydiia bacterium]